jgi:23S rRNA (pseudouridine1915-N3)-methyltransferase
VGKVKRPWADLDAHYRKLLSRHLPVEVVEVRDGPSLEGRIPQRAHVVAMDRGGRAMDSLGWSRWLERRRLDALDLCFLIGGPRGLPAAQVEAADERVSLGPQTMAHDLARIVLLEQLFRAAKILAGEPYHY